MQQATTDQSIAIKNLDEGEQRFRNLIREASVGIVVVLGPEMEVAIVNEAYGKLIDRKPEDLLHRRLFDVIPEAYNPYHGIIDNVRVTGESVYLYEQMYSVYSGEEKIQGYVNLVYQPYKESDGHISGVMILAHDVTKQVLSRKTADEAELRAKLAVEAAGLGTYEVNLLTREIVTSARFDEMADVQRTDEQHRYVEAIHPDDMHIRQKALDIAYKTGALEYEVRVIRKDKTMRWVRIKGRIIFDENNIPVKHIGVAQDITDEKTFAEELARKVNERTAALEASRVDLEKYVEDLKRSNNNLEQFAYAASHDLKEPIRKIHVFSDMLKVSLKNKLSEHELRSFDRMESASRRMSSLIKDLLAYSQYSLLQDKLEEVDLNEVVKEVLQDLDLEIEEKNAVIVTKPLCKIMGHHRQLQQVFHNLIANSIKYSKVGVQPAITLWCEKIQGKEAGLQLSAEEMNQFFFQVNVQDNGIGFDMKDAERIFDVFTRLHGNNLVKGTGVGLSIVRKVMHNHKGYVRAESEVGVGATFLLFFPDEELS